MNDKKVHLSMGRYIYYVVTAILLLCGITYLLSSCTEQMLTDMSGRHGGPMVEVNFTLTFGSFGSDVTAEPDLRSTNRNEEPATEVVRVGKDVYMYATFEKEHPVTTRSATGLEEGALVRVIAYSGAPGFTTEEQYIDYKVESGELVPLTGDGFSVLSDDYKFVAYTFNDALPLPVHISNSTAIPIEVVTNNRYLMWGSTDPITIPALSDTVDITVKHLLSRVKVTASTASIVNPAVNINRVSGAYVNPSYADLTFNPTTGVLTPVDLNIQTLMANGFLRWKEAGSSSAWQDTTFNLNASVIESDYAIIYSHGFSPITLFINNGLWVDNTNLGTFQFRFSQPPIPMEGGNSYVLNLDFKRLIWAGSNIYWNTAENRLTFLPENTPMMYQGLQGVYFHWGSLVGISPNGYFDASTTPLYVPVVGSNTWDVTTSLTSSAYWSGTGLADIPRITGGILNSEIWLDNHRSRNYLYDEIHNPSQLVGDICHYLTESGDAPPGSWRMPNSREFGNTENEYATGNYKIETNWLGAVADDGTTDFYENPYRSYIVKMASSTVFPDGKRRQAGGWIESNQTAYLSGSPTSWTIIGNPIVLDAAFTMFFYKSYSGDHIELLFNSWIPLGDQSPVRCIKLDGGGIPISWTSPHVDVEDWDNGGIFGQGDTAGQGDQWY